MILGGGGAVECRVLHHDTGDDEIILNRNTVYCIVVVLFVRCFDFRQIRFYVMIVSAFYNNKTTEQQIAETNQDCYFALVVQRVLYVLTCLVATSTLNDRLLD